MSHSSIDRAHNYLSTDERVESGKYFGSSIIVAAPATSFGYIQIRTGAGVTTHMSLAYKGTQEGFFEAYTGSTITAPGTAAPVNNFRVGNPTMALLTAFSAPTVTVEGTQILQFLMTGGTGQDAVGASDAIGTKFILPPSFVVLAKMRNSSVLPGFCSLNINFYEVPI